MKDKVDIEIDRMDENELRLFMDRVLETLYWDPNGGFWNPDNEWGSETIEEVAAQVPKRVMAAVRRMGRTR